MDTVFLLRTIQWIAIAMLLIEMIYALTRKPSEMQKHVIVLTIATILSIIGFVTEMDAECLETAIVGTIIGYIGKPFIMLAGFMLIASFYGRKIPKWLFLVLVLISSSFSILVYTNEIHHLYYATVSYDATQKYTPLVTTRGPLYFTYVVAGVMFFSYCLFTIIRGYLKTKSPMRKRLSTYSLLMIFSGMGGYGIYLIFDTKGYDSTILGVSIGSLFLFLLFFRCKIFDIIDIAKDYALEISKDGLMVFDDAGDVIYENESAKIISDQGFTHETAVQYPVGNSRFFAADNIFTIDVKEISESGEYLGKSVEIHDITESFNNQTKLEDAVRERTEKLETMQRVILGSMASVVEARSLETGDHILRVRNYAERIARSLQKNPKYAGTLTEDYINTMALAAPLHDIGKISISDSILLKPGKLTNEEFEEMKKHSASGAKIIRTTLRELETEEYISMAEDIAMYHHERWDGKGYPSGLIGEQIPLSARIVALADCYDALTSKRCYKDAFPDEKAIAIIIEENGTHFDPDVVDAFLCMK